MGSLLVGLTGEWLFPLNRGRVDLLGSGEYWQSRWDVLCALTVVLTVELAPCDALKKRTH